MIEIEMSKDIKDFEPKLIGYFSARQLVCMGIACVLGIPLALLLLKEMKIDMTIALLIIIVVMGFPIACGYVKLYGMYFDVFLFKCVIPMYLSPSKRKYKTVNTFEYFDPEKEKNNKNTKSKKLTKQEKIKRKEDMIKYKAAL